MLDSGNRDLDPDAFIQEAEKWDNRYLEGITHAVQIYNHPQDARALIQEFLSRKNSGAFRLTNPFSKQIWLRQLIPGYLSENKRREWPCFEKDITCALVTFTHKDWACPDTRIGFDLERAKQKVRNALTLLSFIATFEAAYYTNEEWEKDGERGKLVCFHCHAVLWATNCAQLSRLRTRIKPRFKPIFGNKSGIRFDTLKRADDVCRALAYQ